MEIITTYRLYRKMFPLEILLAVIPIRFIVRYHFNIKIFLGNT
jgi:hypothetical protein